MKFLLSNKLKNLYWLLSDKIIRILLGIIVSAYLARYLGPEKLGIIVFSISYFGLFNFLLNSGMDDIVARNLVNSPMLLNEILGSSMIIKLSGGLLSLILSISSYYILFGSNDEFYYIIIISFSGFFYFPFVIESYFQSIFKSKILVVNGLIIFLVSSLSKLFGIYLELNIFFLYFLSRVKSSCKVYLT